MQMEESQITIECTPNMIEYCNLVKRIFREVFRSDIEVIFGEWEERFATQYCGELPLYK